MKIKNILTNDIEIIENFIIKILCQAGIPYIFIKESNEIHFANYIFRFHNKKIALELFNNYISFPTLEDAKNIIEKTISPKDFIEQKKLRPTYKNHGMINQILKKSRNINNRF